MQLAVERRFPRCHWHTFVDTIGTQDSRFYVILQVSGQDNIFQVSFQIHIENRRHNFYSPVEVARHPVRRSDVNVVVASVGEIKNPTVFKELAYDAPDPNGFGQPAYSRPDHAGTANYQVNLHACLGRPVKRVDNLEIREAIYLSCHGSRPACPRVIYLPFY